MNSYDWSLAQWFDAGYAQDDGNVCRRKALPKGYTGADKANLFVKTKVNGVVVWPVRLDIGAMPDSERLLKSTTCTLYHYTHAKSVAACSKIFSQAAEWNQCLGSVKESSLQLLLQLLKEDCSSRIALDPQNPHAGKLLMSSLEPSQFDTQAAVLRGIFGSIPTKKMVTLSGDEVPAEEIGKCCIAIRVPIAACSSAKLSGSQSEVVLVNADKLERELKRLITKQQRQLEGSQTLKKDKSSDKKKCCFPWPFGRKDEQSRSRSMSREAKEIKTDAEPLVNKRLQTAEQIQRAYRVKQLESDFQREMMSRVQKQNRYDSLINAVREDTASKRSKSKSRGASQERRLSIASADSNGSSDKSKKSSKSALDLKEIILRSDLADQQTDSDCAVRAQRSEICGTIKAKGSWKQLTRRHSASQMQ